MAAGDHAIFASLKAAIASSASGERVQNLLLVAFCRTLIKLSSAAFDHQSMSFKDESQEELRIGFDPYGVFLKDLQFVLHGASDNPPAAPPSSKVTPDACPA